MLRKTTIRTTILVNILLVVSVVSTVLLFLQFYFGRELAIKATRKTFMEMSENIVFDMKTRDTASREKLKLLALSVGDKDTDIQNIDIRFREIAGMFMNSNKDIYSLYIAFGENDFAELINAKKAAGLNSRYSAPDNTRWIIIKINAAPGAKHNRRMIFYDKEFRITGTRTDTTKFRPTQRPWYKLSKLNGGKVVKSEPYMFSFLKKNGITYSMCIEGTDRVIGVDFTIESLNSLLRTMKTAQESIVLLFDEKGNIIGSSENNGSHEKVIKKITSFQKTEDLKTVTVDGKEYFFMVKRLSKEISGTTWIGFCIDSDTILNPYKEKIGYGILITLAILLMALPLVLWATGRLTRPIYELMKENKKIRDRKFGDVKLVESNIVELDKLSRSLLDMSESIQAYQAMQKKLLDSFIKLIANAIDKKSPYTGYHCKRVPLIASMLAAEVEKSNSGRFKEFNLNTEEKIEEFELAAWLHDCGKIATPEYVVDKSCKLETIYNRIHEIRTRFEVLWRDIEIFYLKRINSGEAPEEPAAWKKNEQQKLIDDFVFVAKCNAGTESMSSADIDRIKDIAKREWTGHFDRRLGLSSQEIQLMNQSNRDDEKGYLLEDRPEHLIPRRSSALPLLYREHGFTLDIPEYLYNRGEIYNLCITHGTLTNEERFIINEHVITTITMLESLPFPPELARIPEYAGSHHEKPNGKGYPRGLKGNDLSVPSRIMAIADIFEALTASDRPYKKAKRLSVTLKIMANMAKNGDIDTELFKIFLESGIYLKYAAEHIDKKQMDEVDIKEILEMTENDS